MESDETVDERGRMPDLCGGAWTEIRRGKGYVGSDKGCLY